MRRLRRVWRLGRLAAHVALGASLAALLLGKARRRRRPRLVAWWHRRVCRVLGVEVVVHGRPAAAPVLLACNHVSWLDIPAIGGVVDTRFLSKAEVRGWALIGWLAARAGTLFVRRADRAATEATTLEILWSLRQGERVVLFPEGTTTDGSTVRRFRSRLFDAAVLADVPVQPVALRFLEGERLAPTVPFLGEDAFVPHLARLAGHAGLRVEVTFLEPFPARAAVRHTLAARCEAAVRAVVEGPDVSEGQDERLAVNSRPRRSFSPPLPGGRVGAGGNPA
jgi:1-acyl-sn-glycerol-3-phosphate acyltransferase